MTTCAVSFNIGVQNYNKGFIWEKAFKIFFRTSNGQILNEAQEDHENCTRCHAKYNTPLAPTLSVIFGVLMDSYLNP
jgi:hypothetical protein